MTTVSALRRSTFDGITLVCRSAQDIVTFNGLARCGVDVGDDFTVGLYGCWRGNYWVLEHSTGIIYYSDSLTDVREWVKLCREVANESV